MNGNAGNKSSNAGGNAQENQESTEKQQRTHQPADEEIGDYADPDMIQVDGGDNSFVAGEGEEGSGTRKKPEAG